MNQDRDRDQTRNCRNRGRKVESVQISDEIGRREYFRKSIHTPLLDSVINDSGQRLSPEVFGIFQLGVFPPKPNVSDGDWHTYRYRDVSVVTTEIDFYLRKAKPSLRATMAQERLSGLALVNIHKDVNLNIYEIINVLAKKKHARHFNLLARGRKHSNAVCAIGRRLREPDDARRYPTDVYAYEQLIRRASNGISSVKVSTQSRRLESDSSAVGMPTLIRLVTRRIKGLRGRTMDHSTRSNRESPLGDVASAANL
ncbi:hypothetical protein EVAR_8574_1 [Eumeta japonica]|uniref:Uncharacterized protein n=1 Tax=Eumeta variegata TaxID=151549 RepID=A0A4C1TXK8_EUMVA|nr:hypothetical protein EVAR_8574_1 [Eumeta japonica]